MNVISCKFGSDTLQTPDTMACYEAQETGKDNPDDREQPGCQLDSIIDRSQIRKVGCSQHVKRVKEIVIVPEP